jgi:hypothetical protein
VKKTIILSVFLASFTFLGAQQTDTLSKLDKILNHFDLEAYGVINYYHYNWETWPEKRSAIDLERFTIEPIFKINKKIRIIPEIEFEGGGTGATMDFDRFEEFGEFEIEIDKGGAVELEQFKIQFDVKPWLKFQVGKFKIPFSLVSSFPGPTTYLTTSFSETEEELLPSEWAETGVEIYGAIDKKERFQYHIAAVNGLDATGFSSANWIKRGFQSRFETINAENWALVGRFDYNFLKEDDEEKEEHEENSNGFIGVSTYFGNSADNRPKPDLAVPAYVSIQDFHFYINKNGISNKTYFIYGHLKNSEAVTQANQNLSNNLNVKRTPVASDVLGVYSELGYDIFHNISKIQIKKKDLKLIVFGRLDYYDSMFKTRGEVFNNPRWERLSISSGINFNIFDKLTFKSQYTYRKLGTDALNTEKTFSTGIGFNI